MNLPVFTQTTTPVEKQIIEMGTDKNIVSVFLCHKSCIMDFLSSVLRVSLKADLSRLLDPLDLHLLCNGNEDLYHVKKSFAFTSPYFQVSKNYVALTQYLQL